MPFFLRTLLCAAAVLAAAVRGEQVTENFERLITVAENVSQSTIFNACKHSFDCDRTISSWRSYSLPDIIAVAEQWMVWSRPARKLTLLGLGLRTAQNRCQMTTVVPGCDTAFHRLSPPFTAVNSLLFRSGG